MTGDLRSIAEHHARKASSVFAALSGMMIAAMLGRFPGAAPMSLSEYPAAAILFLAAILAGALTVRLDNGHSLRWTILEMGGFFLLGLFAPLLLSLLF